MFGGLLSTFPFWGLWLTTNGISTKVSYLCENIPQFEIVGQQHDHNHDK